MMMSHIVQPTADIPDVIVVGGGPVGSYAALSLAKLGVKVTVFEEHPQIGLPSHCTGHLSIRSLMSMGLYPLPTGIVENTFSAANFYSSKGTKFSIRLSCPVTAVLNRSKFDQYLAQQAQEAGASFQLNSHVKSLIVADGFVKGVTLEDNQKVYSKLTIDAEGISSRLLRQTGLPALKPKGLVFGVEAEVDRVEDVESHAVEVYLGKDYASGFYGWLIPRLDGSAKVGLATNKGNPEELLRKLMLKHPVASKQLSKAKITQISYHAITLGGPIEKSYANGFLAVGDCASQVKPTTGGGVIFGLSCAEIAGQVATLALRKNDVSSDSLRIYQQHCDDLLSFDFSVMLRLRRFLDSLSDEKLDEVLQVCGKLGVDKALCDVDEIDFQGKLLLKVLGKPAVLAALVYFGLLYLSANP
jgi:digeranylgeranylglycerophospholipid reductase